MLAPFPRVIVSMKLTNTTFSSQESLGLRKNGREGGWKREIGLIFILPCLSCSITKHRANMFSHVKETSIFTRLHETPFLE